MMCNGINSLNSDNVTNHFGLSSNMKMSTALSMLIHFLGCTIKSPKQKLFMKSTGYNQPEKWVKIFQVCIKRKIYPANESMEGTIKKSFIKLTQETLFQGYCMFLPAVSASWFSAVVMISMSSDSPIFSMKPAQYSLFLSL